MNNRTVNNVLQNYYMHPLRRKQLNVLMDWKNDDVSHCAQIKSTKPALDEDAIQALSLERVEHNEVPLGAVTVSGNRLIQGDQPVLRRVVCAISSGEWD